MVAGTINRVIDSMRRLATVAGQVALSDQQLLDAFRASADEAAFEALVRRHGPMVLGTCRRILVRPQDAEDALQATFLVLVRKAHTIRRPELLGPWLHLVACRMARRARLLLARRREREGPLTELEQPLTFDRVPDHDLRATLDEALNQLPEHYRAALVLCELQGRSRQQAAHALGVPEGTLSSRLARGRQLLAARLKGRQVLPGGVLAGALLQARAEAVAPALVHATVRAGLAAAVANPAAFSLIGLGEAVVQLVSSMRFRLIVAGVFGLGLLGAALRSEPKAAEPPGQAPQAVAQPAREDGGPRRPSVILLWMNGGPSQLDTFDLKPGQATGGPFKEIDTAVKGIRISEHFPKLAKHVKEMVLIRGLSHREGDHARATHLMRTGRAVQAGVQFATLAEVLGKELGGDQSTVPNYVRLPVYLPAGGVPPGRLGKRFGPLQLYDRGTGVQLPEEGMFTAMADKAAAVWHKTMTEAVDLAKEKPAVRDAYGPDRFGTHCLIARRLVERQVPVVEVTLGGWDSHANNFAVVQKNSAVLDAGWSALLADLKERKLLDSTLIVWMGEFGRTPRINQHAGRDHWPTNFTVVLAGGGLKGGQVIGTTNADGTAIVEGAVSVPELYATIYRAVGVDLRRRYPSGVEGVEVPIIDGPAAPLGAVLPAKASRP